MPEDINNPNPNPAPTSNGDDKNGKGTETQSFDPSKIGDEDFAKVFDDPRLFQHDRFKQLNDKAKKAGELEQAQKAEREAKLVEEKKWRELAESKEKELSDLKTQLQNTSIDNSLVQEIVKIGAVNIDAAKKLIDRSMIKINADGSIEGVKEAVEKMFKDNPFMKGEPKDPTLGAPTAPGNGQGGVKRFKLTQVQDPIFYREHEKEIDEAWRAGQIEDDTIPKNGRS